MIPAASEEELDRIDARIDAWAEAELAELGWAPLRQGRAGQVAFHLLGPLAPGG